MTTSATLFQILKQAGSVFYSNEIYLGLCVESIIIADTCSWYGWYVIMFIKVFVLFRRRSGTMTTIFFFNFKFTVYYKSSLKSTRSVLLKCGSMFLYINKKQYLFSKLGVILLKCLTLTCQRNKYEYDQHVKWSRYVHRLKNSSSACIF